MKTNNKILKKIIFLPFITLLTILSSLIFLKGSLSAQSSDPNLIIYFTGIGCPHCAKVDQILLKEWINEYPDLIVVEYEVYQQNQNAQLIDIYNTQYDSGLGIPLIILDESTKLIGDNPILSSFENELKDKVDNPLILHDGSKTTFNDLDINSLPLYPKIWMKDRVVIRTDQTSSNDNNFIKNFLTTEDLEEIFSDEKLTFVNPQPVSLSGSQVTFDNAIKVDGWLLQWNGPSIKGTDITNTDNSTTDTKETFEKQSITLAKTISLAAVDAVNPCALAVLTMMLIAIITYNPKDKKNIILAGLAFTASVFIMYLIYGLIIIRFFQLVQAITSVRLILYKGLAIVAIILGILEIKDFISYKAGSLGTEMPLSLRPKVKKIISGITSPKGAFGIGAFVTIFLLPCTIGPYIILGGMLSFNEILQSIPSLLIYNFIFVLPMLIITIIVYMGISKVEDVSEWKDKNIKILHLVSGIIITCLGVAMLFGWV